MYIYIYIASGNLLKTTPSTTNSSRKLQISSSIPSRSLRKRKEKLRGLQDLSAFLKVFSSFFKEC